MAFKKLKAKIAKRKKLRTYKKKVKSSTKYAKGTAGRKQKKIDVLAKKRKLGLGNKKRVQKKINRLSKNKKLTASEKKRKAKISKKKLDRQYKAGYVTTIKGKRTR